ncbi:hypothetical protein F3Y22_tig00004041pilonHSYRG00042 [Hibiscus syriacus]|uniref:Uncharacterized protein n=1 Tax=Hibiscus syriacus TaxID=106335 RepID=A0A6A3CJP5_HIBSY|nr:hypothetical protein F3Y22_tig00004041pilonHSYRG00042 [Hibiscus syriacus]
MSSHEEGSAASSVPGGAVSTDETYNIIPEIIISVPHRNLNLSNVDIERLESLDKAFEGDHQLKPTTKPLIQRVPSTLGIPDDFVKYFKPRVISIGPIHHGDPTLRGSEQLKLRLAAHFVKNIGVEKETLYNAIKTEICSLKECYDKKLLKPYDDEKLAWMMFIDGCAILQSILQVSYYYYYEDDDECKSWSRKIIKTDLLTFVYLDLFLVENQLPYRVLQLLITSSSSSKKGLLMKMIEGFVEETFIFPAEIEQETTLKQEGQPVHLLDHLRRRLILNKEKKATLLEKLGFMYLHLFSNCKYKKMDHYPSFRKAEELKNSGIWFKQSETSLLTDVSFSRTFFVGKLRLPPIRVDESTGPMLMNLIAYEMCPDFDNDFAVTSYVCLLDSLVDDAGDVHVLRDDGVLYNALAIVGQSGSGMQLKPTSPILAALGPSQHLWPPLLHFSSVLFRLLTPLFQQSKSSFTRHANNCDLS